MFLVSTHGVTWRFYPLLILILHILKTPPSPIGCTALQTKQNKKLSLHSFRQRRFWVGIDTHVYYKHEHEIKGYGHETERNGMAFGWARRKNSHLKLCIVLHFLSRSLYISILYALCYFLLLIYTRSHSPFL
ncbi:hypothetical protein EYC80_009109 [Monilinia laxa]|uniref:LAGLIDADG endonuclease n=1 Tax=Monilinia laxa TaxID=61186 RepID=A0A5N6K2I9_MONLA|nr:hypothetical protein EYC80_009109 [Monilinia laxa]